MYSPADRLLKLLVLAIFFISILGACNSSESPSFRSKETGAHVKLPDGVPELTIHTNQSEDLVGKLVYKYWFNDSGVDKHEDPSLRDVKPIRLDSDAMVVEFKMDTDVMPNRLRVLGYKQRIGESNVPTGKIMDESCERARAHATCVYAVRDTVSVSIRIPSKVKVLAINAGWRVPIAAEGAPRAAPPEISASWAFVFR